MFDSKSYIEECLKEVNKRIASIVKNEELRAVLVFGSATRPEDFVVGLSDIDILAVTREELERRGYTLRVKETDVNITVISIKELRRIFEIGNPLAFILNKEGKIVEGNGEVSSVIATKPIVTEHTLRVLRNSTFVALGLSIEHYFHEEYRSAISHAYHAIRHLARYSALKKNLDFPVSDDEVIRAVEGKMREVFSELVFIRRANVSKENCKKALENTIEAIASFLKLRHPTIAFLENSCNGKITTVVVRETNESIILKVEVFDGKEIKRYEIDEKCIREVESLFDF